MRTVFRLTPLRSNTAVQIELFQQSLPPGFILDERADGIYLTLETPIEEDGRSQYFVDRELDRLFYLTGLRYRAEMCRRSVIADLKASWSIQASLSSVLRPTAWTYKLAIQLRLWVVVSEVADPFLKMLLLFQIIELSYPDKSAYLDYLDSTAPPHPLKECKMLRNLVAHAGEASATDLKTYCEYLGLPALMLDRTDPTHIDIISAKLPLMESEARKCLSGAA